MDTTLDNVSLQTLDGPSPAGTVGVFVDAVADNLTFWTTEKPVPSFSAQINDYSSVLFNLDDQRAVGVQIENFLTYAVHEHPSLMPLVRVLNLIPRPYGDTRLVTNRLLAELRPTDPDDLKQIDFILRHIIDLTGGVDPDLAVITPR